MLQDISVEMLQKAELDQNRCILSVESVYVCVF